MTQFLLFIIMASVVFFTTGVGAIHGWFSARPGREDETAFREGASGFFVGVGLVISGLVLWGLAGLLV